MDVRRVGDGQNLPARSAGCGAGDAGTFAQTRSSGETVRPHPQECHATTNSSRGVLRERRLCRDVARRLRARQQEQGDRARCRGSPARGADPGGRGLPMSGDRGARRRGRPGLPVTRRSISLLSIPLAICRYAEDAPFPAWVMHAEARFWSITRTDDELSIVCDEDSVPPSCPRVESGWRALRLAGPIDLGETGVLASLAQPLAAAGIALFAISTFDTDYLLVRETDVERALIVLESSFTIDRV